MIFVVIYLHHDVTQHDLCSALTWIASNGLASDKQYPFRGTFSKCKKTRKTAKISNWGWVHFSCSMEMVNSRITHRVALRLTPTPSSSRRPSRSMVLSRSSSTLTRSSTTSAVLSRVRPLLSHPTCHHSLFFSCLSSLIVDCGSKPNHAVLLVGWTTVKNVPAWIVKNSCTPPYGLPHGVLRYSFIFTRGY